jgi:hypothetical protein
MGSLLNNKIDLLDIKGARSEVAHADLRLLGIKSRLMQGSPGRDALLPPNLEKTDEMFNSQGGQADASSAKSDTHIGIYELINMKL